MRVIRCGALALQDWPSDGKWRTGSTRIDSEYGTADMLRLRVNVPDGLPFAPAPVGDDDSFAAFGKGLGAMPAAVADAAAQQRATCDRAAVKAATNRARTAMLSGMEDIADGDGVGAGARATDLVEKIRKDTGPAVSAVPERAGMYDYAASPMADTYTLLAKRREVSQAIRSVRPWANEQADYYRRWGDYINARLTKKPLETSNKTTSYLWRLGTEQIPQIAAYAALGGIGGAARAMKAMQAVVASGAYNQLTEQGVTDPFIKGAAAATDALVTGVTSKFGLEKWVRDVRGLRPYSGAAVALGLGAEAVTEAGQEAVEGVAGRLTNAMANLLGNTEYSDRMFWRDAMKSVSGVEEGVDASVSSLMFGIALLPISGRNYYRAHQWVAGVERTGDIISRTSLFADNKAALAGLLDQRARFDNNPFAYTSTTLLEQAGVAREIATAEVNEGGLGISPESYDAAAVSGEMIHVGQGTMAVFAQAQKEGGNADAANAFSIDVNGATVGEIKAEAAEMREVARRGEETFMAVRSGDDSMLPKVLRTIRAGYRAAGFDTQQADAMIAMTHAGAERNAELWGITEEEWLRKHINLRIQVAGLLLDANRPQAKYFAELAGELWGMTPDGAGRAAPLEGAATPPMRPRTPAAERADAAAQPEQAVPEAVQAQPDGLAELTEGVAAAAGTDAQAVAPIIEQAVAEIRSDPEAAAELQQADNIIREAETLFVAPEAAPAPAPEPAGVSPATGGESEVILPREAGIAPIPVRYALVEADTLQPSHTPRTFAVNPAWPTEAVAQQRNYDAPAMAATRQSIQLDPLDYGVLFNPTTDAVNGSPIITPDRLVLGGNNRTLRILNRYDQDGYKAILENELARPRSRYFGIAPDAAAGMKKPVLVRVAEGVTPENVPSLIGDLNRDFTNRRDAGNLAANRGAAVGKQTLRAFAGIGDQTVSQWLDEPDRAMKVMQAMLSEGVFQQTDLPEVVNVVDWTFRPGGKQAVEAALFGAVLPDSRMLEEMTPALRKKITRALPALIRLKNAGSSELAELFQAVRWNNEYQDFKETTIGRQYKTDAARLEAFRKPDIADMFTGEVPPEKGGAAWDMMLEISRAKSQKEVADFFARKADELTGTGRGLFSLAQGPAQTRLQREAAAFAAEVAKVAASGKPPFQAIPMLRQTPLVLQLLGPDRRTGKSAGNREMRVAPHVFQNILTGDHTLTFDMLKQIPAAMADPIMIFDSDTVPGDLVFMLELLDDNGATVVVPVALEARGEGGVEINIVKSAYAKESGGVPNNDWFRVQAAKNTRYVNEEKLRSWQQEPGVQFPFGLLPDSLDNNEEKLRVWQQAAGVQFPFGLLPNPDNTDSRSWQRNTGVQSPVVPLHNANNTIHTDADLVKLRGENPALYQSAAEAMYLPNGERGRIVFEPDRTVIELFRGADTSTVIHELNHLFLTDMVKAFRSGRGGERLAAHVKTLNDFTGGELLSADKEAAVRAYERIAAAWEGWAMLGTAPSAGLEEPFEVFRRYLTNIYQNLDDRLRDAAPSDAVRRVFDAMLATDDEIEATSERRAVRDEFEAAGLGGSAVAKAINKQLANRDKRRARALDARNGVGKQLSVQERARRLRQEVQAEILKGAKGRVYRAIQLAKAKGGISRETAVKLVGGETVQQIAIRHGEDVFGFRASSPQIAAQIGYGMENDADMLADMATAAPLAELVNAEADRRAGLETAAEDAQAAADAGQGPDDEDPAALPDSADAEINDNDEDLTDARDVAEAAVIDDVTEGGTRAAEPETAARMVDALAKFRADAATAKTIARETVYKRRLFDAKDISVFRKLHTETRRKSREVVRNGAAAKAIADVTNTLSVGMADSALRTARQKDFAALAKLAREELLYTYCIKYAEKARALDRRFKTDYSAAALRKLFDAPAKNGSPKAKMEHKYTVATARLATWAGIADSKYLRDKAANDIKTKDLIPEAADSQLFGGELGFAAETPEWLKNFQMPAGAQGYRDFTVEDVFEIDRVMRYLIRQGRGELLGLQEDVAADLDEFREKSLAPILARPSRSAAGKATANEWGDPNTVTGRVGNLALQYKNELLSPEFIFQMMDGNPTIHGKEMGFNQRFFWKQMSDAGINKKLLIDEINRRNAEAYKVLSNFAKRWRKANKVGLWGGAGVMRAFGKDYKVNPLLRSVNTRTQNPNTILSFVLQTGNDANLRHLLSDSEFASRFGYDPATLGMKTDEAGNEVLDASRYNYTNEDVAAFWAQLTAEEADAIQTIWDNNDFIYEAADKVHFQLTNRHMTKERSVGFTITTVDGVRKTMRGGYAPIANNYQMNIKQKGGTEVEDNKSILEGVSARGERNPGSLKSRLRNEQGIPMATTPTTLDLKVMFRHNNLMAHYITHAVPYRDLSRVMADEEWSASFTDRMGQAYYRTIQKWLEENSIPPHSPNSALDRIMSFVRQRATIGILGYRLSSGLKQAMLGPTQAIAHMSDAAGGNYAAASGFYAKAFAEFTATSVGGAVGYNRRVLERTKAKSRYMRARDGGMDREVMEMRAQVNPISGKFFGISMKQVDDAAMIFIQQGDRLATFTAWNAGYMQAMAGMAGYDMSRIRADAMKNALAKGKTEGDAEAAGLAAVEESAVLYADSVARTQASSFAADLSEMQRSNSIGRYVSMFMSGNIRQASRVNQRLDDAILQGKPVAAAVDLTKFHFQEFVMPSLVNTLFNAGLKAAVLAAWGLAPEDDDDILANLAWETAGTSVGYLPLVRDAVSAARYGTWTLGGSVPAIRFVADTSQKFVSAYKDFGKGDYGYALGNFMMGAGSVLGIPVMNLMAFGDLDRYTGLRRARRGSSLAEAQKEERAAARAAAKEEERAAKKEAKSREQAAAKNTEKNA